jgi:hypothetical protein
MAEICANSPQKPHPSKVAVFSFYPNFLHARLWAYKGNFLYMSILTIVLAALATFVIGFLFHGPFFGKIWMRLANIHPTGNEKFADMVPQIYGT